MIKKRFFLTIALSFFITLFVVSHAFSEENKNFQLKKQPEIQQVKPKKHVKIKLKRSADDRYTWELSGDNVDEIFKADRRLRKLLKIE